MESSSRALPFASGGNSSEVVSDGLNPNRQRGFAAQSSIETSTLNDMKAKQVTIVSKFMTFANHMNTVMIEIYDKLGLSWAIAGFSAGSN